MSEINGQTAVTVRPGDTLVVAFAEALTAEGAQLTSERLAKFLPDGVDIAVIAGVQALAAVRGSAGKGDDDEIVLSLEDARHLFDLAIDTPLLCSGSFETDDVALLRKLAGMIKVDPATATPDDFVYDFPHPFKPFTTSGEHNYVYDATAPGGSRPETDAEVYARLGENPDRCSAGSYNRLCRRPASDPIHQAEGENAA